MSNQCDQFKADGSVRCEFAFHDGPHSWERQPSAAASHARLRELAKPAARVLHYENPREHSGSFGRCSHADCVLIRTASSPVADSPTIQTVVDVSCGQRNLHVDLPASEYRRICHAILSDTAQCPKCRNIVTECSFCYQDRASRPSPSAGAAKEPKP